MGSKKPQPNKKELFAKMQWNCSFGPLPLFSLPSSLHFHNKILNGEKTEKKIVDLEWNTNNAICHDSIFKQKGWPALMAI